MLINRLVVSLPYVSDVYGYWFDHLKEWEQKFKKLDSHNYPILYYEDMQRVSVIPYFLELHAIFDNTLSLFGVVDINSI